MKCTKQDTLILRQKFIFYSNYDGSFDIAMSSGPAEIRFPFFLRYPDRLWGPTSLLSNGIGGDFHEHKLTRPEADHLSPSSAEVKNCGPTYPPLQISSSLIN
jgi:hypothetical protein